MRGRDERWPDATQALALRAAVAGQDEAVAAWQELTDTVDLAELGDREIYRLLPLVWRHLGERVGTEHLDWLKGLYREAWVQNQHHLHHASELVGRLAAEGIDSLLLKGLPVAILYYDDLGARPMGDVDLLVRPDQASAAWRLLEGVGYETISIRGPHPSRWEQDGDDDWYRRLRHARGFRRAPLDVIDLHTTISLDFVAADPAVADTSALWADARPLDLEGTLAATLSPTFHLFHAIVHGLGASEQAELRWVPDALTILAVAGDEIDWVAFVAAAQHHCCGLLVGEGVDHLVEVWDAPIPADVGARLRALPHDRRESGLRWIRRRVGRRLVGSGYATGLFVTSTRGLGPLATMARAPGFLADHWQVDRRHLPMVLAHKLRAGRSR